MDQPLFGDENKKSKKIVTWVLVSILAIITLATIIMAIVKGSLATPLLYQHYIFSGLLLALFVYTLTLIIWDKKADEIPAFKALIVFMGILVIVACVVLLFYIWGLSWPGSDCHDKNGMFVYDSGTCYTDQAAIDCLGKPGNCLVMQYDGEFRCGTYNFTSTECY
eukprot:gb/GECH01012592.1/.p1 GENE.gb/GECH01012592.1/~~gb/GECH01012592.1/.p1  ORF type:complete len:165 (+),score=16.60 gb/GECH01012592.1/:1-495(+)